MQVNSHNLHNQNTGYRSFRPGYPQVLQVSKNDIGSPKLQNKFSLIDQFTNLQLFDSNTSIALFFLLYFVGIHGLFSISIAFSTIAI